MFCVDFFYLRNKTKDRRRSESRSPRRKDAGRSQDDHKRRRENESGSSGRFHSRKSSDNSDSDVEIRKKDKIYMKPELPLEPVVGKVKFIESVYIV